MSFICQKMLNARATLAIWNFDACANLRQVYFFENGGRSNMDNDFNGHFNLRFTFFSNLHILFQSFSTELKSLLPEVAKCEEMKYACTPLHISDIVKNGILQSFLVRITFLKQPMRIRASLRLRRAVRVNARNSCMKLCTCFCLLLKGKKYYGSRYLEVKDQNINKKIDNRIINNTPQTP